MAQQSKARHIIMMQLEALWQRHASQVYTLALRLLANPDDAETIVAEVFLRAHQGMPALQVDEGGRLLLWTIGLTLAWLRRQSRLSVPNNNASLPLRISLQAAQQPACPDPIELEKRILQLPDYWRIVFVLFDVVGLGNDEIAAYLRTDEVRIRQAVHHARLALRNSMQEQEKT